LVSNRFSAGPTVAATPKTANPVMATSGTTANVIILARMLQPRLLTLTTSKGTMHRAAGHSPRVNKVAEMLSRQSLRPMNLTVSPALVHLRVSPYLA
jgi:hypothetical protein